MAPMPPGSPPDLALQRLLIATELSREQEEASKPMFNASRHNSSTYHHYNTSKVQQHHHHVSSTALPSSKKSKKPEFLVKLYRMLQCEDPTIICWDNGRIHVHDPRVLGTTILHKYFRHSKYSSFQRQLNYFGFRKTQGKGKLSACTYTNFDLTNASLKSLLKIKRKTNAAASNSSKGMSSIDLYDDDDVVVPHLKDSSSDISREDEAPTMIVADRLIFLYQLAAAEEEMEQDEVTTDDNDEQGMESSSHSSHAEEEDDEEMETGFWQQQEDYDSSQEDY